VIKERVSTPEKILKSAQRMQLPAKIEEKQLLSTYNAPG